jgi:hypothetical protein
MDIGVQFNKFYHSRVLNDLHRKANTLLFRHLYDTRTNGAFKITKYEDWNDLDDLKQLLKLMNLDYPISEDEKESTKSISVENLLQHIEFVFYISGYNGIELDVIREEWELLLKNYRN